MSTSQDQHAASNATGLDMLLNIAKANRDARVVVVNTCMRNVRTPPNAQIVVATIQQLTDNVPDTKRCCSFENKDN